MSRSGCGVRIRRGGGVRGGSRTSGCCRSGDRIQGHVDGDDGRLGSGGSCGCRIWCFADVRCVSCAPNGRVLRFCFG